MKFSRLGRVVALAVTCLVVLLGIASSANAAAYGYCGYLVPANTACPEAKNSGGNSFYENIAAYTGTGTVSVCQKVQTNAGQISRRCRNRSAETLGDLGPYAGVQMIAYVGNDSPYAHTINGIAYTY